MSGSARSADILLEQTLAPVPGGTGRYSKEIAAALVRVDPTRMVKSWTAWHRDLAAARVDGVDGPHRIALPRRGLIAAWDAGLGPVPHSGDVLHAPTLLAPPRRDRPLVVTIHDAVPWTHPKTLTPRGVAWHRRVAERVAKQADAIVVPTRAVAHELAEHVDFGDKITVIGLGVSADLDLPADADARAEKMNLPEEYLLSVATLEPRKGLDVLLTALANPMAPKHQLLIVGQPGWGGIEPMAEAKRLGLGVDRVRVLGRLSDADLAVALRRATVLVAPSRAEGFGIPVLEAMSVGVPVVHSDAPALVEVGGGATIVVPREQPRLLAEALRGVVEDPSLQRSLAAAGMARARDFTWDEAARALWSLYDDVVKRS